MEGLKSFLARNRNGVVLALLLFVSLIALSTQSQAISEVPKQIGYSVFSSVQKGFSNMGLFFKDVFNSIGELREIRAEYEVLQKRLSDYRTMERELIDLKSENSRLREIIDISESLTYEHVASRVIAKDPGILFNGFTIDKGRKDGLVEDSPVVAFSDGFNSLVGRVAELSSTTAKVLPLTDLNCYVASKMRESRYEGLLHGNGSTKDFLEMEYVNKQAKDEIRFGDLVITSGLRSIYPAGIYIGRVKGVQAPEWESSLTLEITPLVDFSRLEYVYVLLREEE